MQTVKYSKDLAELLNNRDKYDVEIEGDALHFRRRQAPEVALSDEG